MNRKQIKKLAMSAVVLVLAIALIWLIVALVSRDPNAAGETVNSTKSTAFPYEDDNLEIEVEGDPEVDGEKDPPSDDDQNADSNGEKDPADGGDATTEENQDSGTGAADPEDGDTVISGDNADAYINADDFFS